MSPIAGTTPYARRPMVRLKHPYADLVQEACREAYNVAVEYAIQVLILGMSSPIPKLTGFLRSQTRFEYRPTAGGINLLLHWANVPYAQYLIQHADEWQFKHPIDPMAVGDFPEPAMELVWRTFFSALCVALEQRGIEYTAGGG